MYLLKYCNLIPKAEVLYVACVDWMVASRTGKRLFLSIIIILSIVEVERNVIATIKLQVQKFCKRIEKSVSRQREEWSTALRL